MAKKKDQQPINYYPVDIMPTTTAVSKSSSKSSSKPTSTGTPLGPTPTGGVTSPTSVPKWMQARGITSLDDPRAQNYFASKAAGTPKPTPQEQAARQAAKAAKTATPISKTSPPVTGGGDPTYPAYPGGAPGQTPSPYAYNDPFSMFLSAVPGMRMNTQRQIGDAMASAGFTGNRWGTSAMNQAGQIGAESAMTENALLQKTLSDYANRTEDRSLQATGMGIGLGQAQDQMAQDRFMLPSALGQWEQGRQDDLAKFAYQDFEQNKTGWLPMLLQAAMSQGSGSPGPIYQTQEAGKPGAIDWMTLLGGLFK